MNPLHVAHVVCSDGFAGVEKYVLQSAIALHHAGCRVSVVGGAEATMGVPLREHGIGWVAARGMRDAYRELRRLDDVDVIDSHMTAADTAAVAVAIGKRIPVVSTRHFGARRGGGPARRMIGSLVSARLAGQIAISQFVADHIEGESTVIRTGVLDSPDVDETERRRVVLVVQRLEPEKSTDVALRAWAVAGHQDSWRLRIVGDGSERNALEALAAELGIAGSVDFDGFRSDVGSLLSTASLLLSPTPREGLGLAAIEAMAFGVPIVAAGGGGHLETVGSEPDAALFEPGDADAAGRLLAGLIDDPVRRVSYGRRLRERQRESFSVVAQTSATLELLSAAAGRPTVADA